MADIFTELRAAQELYEDAGVDGVEGARMMKVAADKIEGLDADLRDAVRVAYNNGAVDWAHMNYPAWVVGFKRESKE